VKNRTFDASIIDATETQEFLVVKNLDVKNKKAIVFIHGFNGVGAWEKVWDAKRILEQGYIAILPSQMGFGDSIGQRDYCGPKTVKAIVDGLKVICSQYGLTSDDLVVRGHSRGAIVTATIATDYPDTASAYICMAGAYDAKLNQDDPVRNKEMKDNVIKETFGAGEVSMGERSPVLRVQNITKPVFILHGDADDVINVEQAYLFENALKQAGKKYEIKILGGVGHRLSRESRPLVFEFANRVFGEKIDK
jgi:dipeptidyl aminopeptidase/acylaminoacyl peptidase